MRVFHVTEYCHLGSTGGTEQYIRDLLEELNDLGRQNSLIWLKGDGKTEVIDSDGLKIFSLPAPPMRVDAPLGEFRESAKRLLEQEKPDWLHFHTFGLSEAVLAGLARELGIRCAFTYHSPAWSCRRETMLLHGRKVCDGEVRAWRCSVCQAGERLGNSVFGGQLAAGLSAIGGWATLPLERSSLRRRSAFFYDTLRYRSAFRRFLSDCDLVVACCDWSIPVLRRNGVRESSLFHCPQGVSGSVAGLLRALPPKSARDPNLPFIVGYIGRVVEEKGVHILAEGFSRIEGSDARLRIVGWAPDCAHLPYHRRLQALADQDSRIELVPKMPFAEALGEYQSFSLFAIPSVWLETGPLTLLEALASGVPVAGSRRIGQMTLLRQHGTVVEPNTPDAWQRVISEAYAKWKRNGRSPVASHQNIRTMSDVAAEMSTQYDSSIVRDSVADN